MDAKNHEKSGFGVLVGTGAIPTRPCPNFIPLPNESADAGVLNDHC